MLGGVETAFGAVLAVLAMGSADEVKGVLLVATALGYIEAKPMLVDGLDRAARTYCKLRK